MRLPWQTATPALNLALQGGGAHGAFTWGVLDALLEDGRVAFDGVSGTSAGAMNAVALAAGLMAGGREGARATLRRFWQRVAELSPFHHIQSSPLGGLMGSATAWMAPWVEPWQQAASALGSQLSPYQLNPLNLNPLRDILRDTVDFDRVRTEAAARELSTAIAKFLETHPDDARRLADHGWRAAMQADPHLANKAKEGCPVSKVLNAKISLDAALVG